MIDTFEAGRRLSATRRTINTHCHVCGKPITVLAPRVDRPDRLPVCPGDPVTKRRSSCYWQHHNRLRAGRAAPHSDHPSTTPTAEAG